MAIIHTPLQHVNSPPLNSLDPNWQQIVKGILNTAASQIRSQARAATRVGQLDQGRTLDSIAVN
jgi:hypothetical protein